MKNYIVGHLSFFENELEFQKSDLFPSTIEDLKDYYWNADAVLNVKEIQ